MNYFIVDYQVMLNGQVKESGTAGVVSSTTDYKPQLVKTTAEKDYRDRLNPTGHVNIHFYTEKRPVTKNEYDLGSPFTIDIK